jgi:hypothetical protein
MAFRQSLLLAHHQLKLEVELELELELEVLPQKSKLQD